MLALHEYFELGGGGKCFKHAHRLLSKLGERQFFHGKWRTHAYSKDKGTLYLAIKVLSALGLQGRSQKSGEGDALYYLT